MAKTEQFCNNTDREKNICIAKKIILDKVSGEGSYNFFP